MNVCSAGLEPGNQTTRSPSGAPPPAGPAPQDARTSGAPIRAADAFNAVRLRGCNTASSLRRQRRPVNASDTALPAVRQRASSSVSVDEQPEAALILGYRERGVTYQFRISTLEGGRTTVKGDDAVRL